MFLGYQVGQLSTAGDRLPECPPISPLWEWDVETSQAKHKSVEHVPSLEPVLQAQKHWVLYRFAVTAPLGELSEVQQAVQVAQGASSPPLRLRCSALSFLK